MKRWETYRFGVIEIYKTESEAAFVIDLFDCASARVTVTKSKECPKGCKQCQSKWRRGGRG